ncbi:Holliday junction DNA helicase RuvB [Treponema rectale]|uniref:Holliday junction branch migration complex subunit RuvB n=2 Tax=Treponema rectale TaxID=744512 RepID=A0A840SA06_9SPIR|nr:Holliday junction branch migration DNA helicase RuvB [Treponema rectale]MBB5218537.1 Holliday junction DNA helicase RuvB [Treponema rectale]
MFNKSVTSKSSYQKKNNEEDDMNIVSQLASQAAFSMDNEYGGRTKIVRAESLPTDSHIVRADVFSAEDVPDNSLRPKLLDDFLGQSEIKKNLKVFIDAAKQRNEPLDHLFLIGPPGLGKTTLAQITANELGADFKVTSAPALDKPKDLAGILSTITPGTVFFIDEIHRLKPAIEEMLYIAMEDFELDWVIGQGAAARTVRIPIPHFTLAGATTKAGMVSKPLQTRFGIVQRLRFYDDNELADIIRRSAGILGTAIDDDAAMLLAGCSRGTPRVTNRLLRRMRDYAQHAGSPVVTSEIVREGLEKLGIDNLGLENYDREILLSIMNNFGGGPVGAETLAISIGESQDTLEDYYEPYLIQCGLIQRTPRGRIVTQKAYEHLGMTPASDSLKGQGSLF